MMFRKNCFMCSAALFLFTAIGLSGQARLAAAETRGEEAWKALPKYEYGQDMAALLTMDRVVIQAMASPEARAACAKRLASLLTAEETTFAARQYICLQLRQIGTSAEVPVLAKLLVDPKTSEIARYALESIPGRESMAALRSGLTVLEGKPLIGVINSVAARKDAAAAPVLQRLADSQDSEVAAAALWALGGVAGERAGEFLAARAEQAGFPTPQDVAVPLLRCAEAQRRAGKTEQAKAAYEMLSRAGQMAGVRRAALGGLLRLQGDQAGETVLAWLADPDPDRSRVAAGRLDLLSDEQIDQLMAKLTRLPTLSQLAVLERSVARRGRKLLPKLYSLIESDNSELRLAGVRGLGLVGDASAAAVLIQTLSAGGDLTRAAEDALVHLPRRELTPTLLDALRRRPAVRESIVRVLVKMKCYEAIDPLIEIASRPDPNEYGPALEGLRGIADPDKTDIPRLIKLLLKTEPGKHRDEVEKTILIVCDKLPPGADRSKVVLDSLGGLDPSQSPKYLPLLGRLGGPRALEMIRSSLASGSAGVREAAVRALCNWPNAEVADQLLQLARESDSRTYRRWALRAYIRVITLKSNRSDAVTLAMLQTAASLAEGVDEKRLAIERAATIRTMDAVNWLASFLDDPDLAQAACGALVELAHHRFLRQPNMDRFEPILEKIARISKDPDVAERARRYRLGL